ncbi:hypothetical protein, partial [Serratia bockelmannii]
FNKITEVDKKIHIRKIIHFIEIISEVLINIVTSADKKPATPTPIAMAERLNNCSPILPFTFPSLWHEEFPFSILLQLGDIGHLQLLVFSQLYESSTKPNLSTR